MRVAYCSRVLPANSFSWRETLHRVDDERCLFRCTTLRHAARLSLSPGTSTVQPALLPIGLLLRPFRPGRYPLHARHPDTA
jgi:hypothetical protein